MYHDIRYALSRHTYIDAVVLVFTERVKFAFGAALGAPAHAPNTLRNTVVL